jgi:hypothetical protein
MIIITMRAKYCGGDGFQRLVLKYWFKYADFNYANISRTQAALKSLVEVIDTSELDLIETLNVILNQID